MVLLRVNFMVACYHKRIRVTLLSFFCECDNYEA